MEPTTQYCYSCRMDVTPTAVLWKGWRAARQPTYLCPRCGGKLLKTLPQQPFRPGLEHTTHFYPGRGHR